MVERRMEFLGLDGMSAVFNTFMMLSRGLNGVSGDKQVWFIRSYNENIRFRSDNLSESKSS